MRKLTSIHYVQSSKMRPINKPVLFRKDDNCKNHNSVKEDRENVKPLHGPLFRPKAKSHMIKRHTFLVTLSL